MLNDYIRFNAFHTVVLDKSYGPDEGHRLTETCHPIELI